MRWVWRLVPVFNSSGLGQYLLVTHRGGLTLLETLLGTCANAGATLVAIIGGLLISRYLGIDSEIRGSKERAAELERATRNADSRFADADAEYARFRIECGLDDSDAYEELRDAWIDRREPDIGRLRRIDPELENYPDAELQKIIDDWMAEIPRADKALSSVELSRSNDWSDVRIGNEFDVKVEAVWEQEFDRRMRELPSHPLLGVGPYLPHLGVWRKEESDRLRAHTGRSGAGKDSGRCSVCAGEGRFA